ncbi:response regulator [Pseudobacteriovorax antillogorgiicola]|uniref:Response regulator receiver domain-containing protein n=1 Tax=Pseudobacteriovorax antillogorgiicola TaxID=1513793 RepID=A0A1Y6CGX2_9BACT|nr:response regulator [Pseudobacteriovorax antillogorgiicola]TCS46963.1 response regulator receiver domain-containing protein [Pseudobacteriovorax antillogorgiicola]SMF64607.1 Response regulator receiver domain-containing protein [Pseudobacteriovorax antillogorgiicola]
MYHDNIVFAGNETETIQQSFHRTGPLVVVDDDLAQQKIVENCYKKSKSKVDLEFFRSGEEFIAWLCSPGAEGRSPKMVLLDINMPGLDGFDVLNELKQRDILCEIPTIVMLSTSNSKEDIEKSLDLGADAFWPKPMSLVEYVDFFKSLD